VTLNATIHVKRGRFALDLEVHVGAGEVVVLLGPNGAGKTTALHVLAGLVPADAAHVELDGEVLDDTVRQIRAPTERRPVGLVFQDYLLFPHLSALDNVAFGLRCRGMGRSAARAQALAWLRRVGLEEQAQARPALLSGGQAQRVALARALAVEPRLLLLDEPLAALDAGTRLAVRGDLARHLRAYGGCTLVVTHDSLDAMVLGDRLVVVEDGAVVQEGRPQHVARHPRTDYVARLVGLNLFRGTARGHEVALAEGAGMAVVPMSAHGEVFVAFPPAAVTVHRSRPDGSARNVWPGRVVGLELHGDLVRVEIAGPPAVLADVTPAAVADLALAPGESVWVAVKASEVAAYPA
jgi:molybdate transport system ATP-binding protein